MVRLWLARDMVGLGLDTVWVNEPVISKHLPYVASGH